MNNKPYFEVETVVLKGSKRLKHSENLNRIRLPFYCTFSFDGGKNTKLGIVDWDGGYFLQNHSEQKEIDSLRSSVIDKFDKLLNLIQKYNISVVKVKIIMFQ